MNVSIRRIASAFAAATALTIIGASAASASGPLQSTLTVSNADSLNDVVVTVRGHLDVIPSTGQAICDRSGNPVDVEIWGQDPGWDDLLITKTSFRSRPMTCEVDNDGLDFEVSIEVDGEVLNEGVGTDEIYAYVTFNEIAGLGGQVDASNLVYRKF